MNTTLSHERTILHSPLVESRSKMALLAYMADKKMEPKNHQKKSLFWDRQHLQQENIMLRQKIKELGQNNMKANTKLMISQKKIHHLTRSNTDHKKSQSFFRAISSNKINLYSTQKILKQQNKISTSKFQQQAKLILKLQNYISQLKCKLQSQKQQNLTLKRSIKNTRMNELQIENKEIQQEILRLYGKLNHYKKLVEDKQIKINNQLEQYKKVLKKEIDGRNRILKELSICKKSLIEKQQYINRINKELNDKLSKNKQIKKTFSAKKGNNQKNPSNLQYSISKLQHNQTHTFNLINSDLQLNSTHKLPFNNNLTSLQLQTNMPHPKAQQFPFHTSIMAEEKEVILDKYPKQIKMKNHKDIIDVKKQEIVCQQYEKYNEQDEYNQNFDEQEYKNDQFENDNVIATNNILGNKLRQDISIKQKYKQKEKVHSDEYNQSAEINQYQQSQYQDLLQEI